MRSSATFGGSALQAPRRSNDASRSVPHRRHWESLSGAFEALVLVAIVVLLVIGAVSTAVPKAVTPQATTSLRVRTGDTLWTVAASHPVDGLTTAQTVDLLAETNQLATRSLMPGQVISVPAQESRARLAAR
jgi:LysM repeat protein